MKKSDFQFDLPESLIAQFPPKDRGDSRLMVLDGVSGEINHSQFNLLADYLRPGDLLVLNDTKVIPARVFAQKPTGGQVEILVDRIISATQALCHMKASKAAKIGSVVHLSPSGECRVIDRQGSLFLLDFQESLMDCLDRCGHMPLPPYIEREDQQVDESRYQTVFAENPGAVAAPTAGLHFTDELLAALQTDGVDTVRVTLHVGSGTFQPVRVDDLEDHTMHAEWLCLDESVVAAVNRTKANGGRVVAVGTTAMRALESAATSGALEPFEGETRLFITPGYQFNVVDAMVTNFHLSESTLLMLVSAFAGYENIRQAYALAIAESYRFFSYGDAMFLTKTDQYDLS